MRVRWGDPGVRLGPELGKTHKDGPEGWLLCQAESFIFGTTPAPRPQASWRGVP